MGNQQSQDGPQFCSTKPHPLAARFMVDKAFRVDYTPLKIKNTEVMRIPKKQQLVAHGQQVSNTGTGQQIQEEYIDVPVKQPEMLKITEKTLRDEVEHWTNVNKSGAMFQGIYGDILLLPSGFVVYKDIAGHHYREEYNSKKIQKIFPMGISCAGLTKILWFKDVEDRNVCFDTMNGDLPPSYDEVMANPGAYNIPECLLPKSKKASCNFKVFDGIRGNKVVLHNGYVNYTDLDGVKQFSSYQKDYIKKCFPQGICFGGLERTIWLADEAERDRCFMLMQMGGEKKEEEKNFPGLYGNVVLKKDGVSFTSLVGERITAARYDSKSVRRVFPMGISGGGLPHSIWFKEMGDMENCFKAMMQN